MRPRELDPVEAERRRLFELERVEAEKFAARTHGSPSPSPDAGTMTTAQPTGDYFEEHIPAWTHGCLVERRLDACQLLETAYVNLRRVDKLLDAATSACDLGAASSCTTVGMILLDEPDLGSGRQPRGYFERACDGGDGPGCTFLASSYPRDSPAARAARRRACRLGVAKSCR